MYFLTFQESFLLEVLLSWKLHKNHRFYRNYFFLMHYQILGNAKKPDVVQQHFKSLYDNINKCKLVKVIPISNAFEIKFLPNIISLLRQRKKYRNGKLME